MQKISLENSFFFENMYYWQKDPKKDNSHNSKVNTLVHYMSFAPISMRSTRFWHLKDLGGCSCRRTLDWIDFMIIFVTQCCFQFMLKFKKRQWMKQRSNCQSAISQKILFALQMNYSGKHIWSIKRKRMMK